MLNERVDKLIWICMFAGLAGLGLGVAVARSDSAIGGCFMVGGVVLMVVGATLLWRRSRERSRS